MLPFQCPHPSFHILEVIQEEVKKWATIFIILCSLLIHLAHMYGYQGGGEDGAEISFSIQISGESGSETTQE